MNILIYGPQGSGKSTQAKILAEKFGLLFISAGDISRQLSQENSSEGRRVKALIDQGEPTPHKIIVREINRLFDSPESKNGFVLDGYPRYAQQVESLVQSLEDRHWEIGKVIVIKLSQNQGVERIMSRAAAERRADDTPETIARRLELYHQQTEPIISYFKKLGKVIEVDGSGTIEEVTALIVKALQNDTH